MKRFKFLRIIPPKRGKPCKKCRKPVSGENAAPKLTADGVRTWTCRSCQRAYYQRYRAIRKRRKAARYAKLIAARKKRAA